VISDEFKNLNERLFIKAFDLNDYFQLENDLACFLWISLRFLFDHKDSPKSRILRLHTILKRCGKVDWIKNAVNKDYFRSKICNYLFPALKELEENGYFSFKIPETGKYDPDGNYIIERLYHLKRDDMDVLPESVEEE
jgi:hypothetical protein